MRERLARHDAMQCVPPVYSADGYMLTQGSPQPGFGPLSPLSPHVPATRTPGRHVACRAPGQFGAVYVVLRA